MMLPVRACAAPLFALAFLATALAQDNAPAVGPVKPLKQWGGSIDDAALQKQAPANGVLTDAKSFAKLWTAWKIEGKVPDVDFAKNLVVVETTTGGRLRTSARLEANGNLKILGLATRDLRPGFRYEILVLPRSGVKTVNGKALAAE
jgi:hypothetical protein